MTNPHLADAANSSRSATLSPFRLRAIGVGAALLFSLAIGACSTDNTTYPDEPFSDVDSSVPAADGAADGVVDGTEDGTGPEVGSDIDGDGTNGDVPAEAEN